MKKLLLFALLSNFAFAQKSVKLHLRSFIDNQEFAYQVGSQNNLNHLFKIKRLHYYLGDVEITYDGGQKKHFSKSIFLLKADETPGNVILDLGTHDVNNVEQVRFAIGVKESLNHDDPTQYDASHPLAPQMPAMHWGWAAGYRFIILEGKTGPAFKHNMEIHALGDTNYFHQTIAVTSLSSENEIHIPIKADFGKILDDVSINSSIIHHGETFQSCMQVMQNLKNKVFSYDSDYQIGVEEELASIIKVFPNPSNGVLRINNPVDEVLTIKVFNVFGQEVFQKKSQEEILDLSHLSKGNYFLELESSTGKARKKIILL
ncbi:MAG: T9SS type A sorting domain-containing protein [Flavobacteriales bacterium]|jgi:hypothetical protein|nr:T9SS type A sorting domain-containing protein [Flavobacteriales bacterium]